MRHIKWLLHAERGQTIVDIPFRQYEGLSAVKRSAAHLVAFGWDCVAVVPIDVVVDDAEPEPVSEPEPAVVVAEPAKPKRKPKPRKPVQSKPRNSWGTCQRCDREHPQGSGHRPDMCNHCLGKCRRARGSLPRPHERKDGGDKRFRPRAEYLAEVKARPDYRKGTSYEDFQKMIEEHIGREL
jgi:hypothetical protein